MTAQTKITYDPEALRVVDQGYLHTEDGRVILCEVSEVDPAEGTVRVERIRLVRGRVVELLEDYVEVEFSDFQCFVYLAL